MPEISRFYGIVIKMFFADHNPPHFHAEYGGQEAILNIRTLALISGRLPPLAFGLVMERASLHQDELMGLWEDASRLEPLHRIEPLP
jgi:hypothetical protein